MSIVIGLLWVLGLVFLVLVWMTLVAAAMRAGTGLFGRRPRSRAPVPPTPARPWARGLVAGAAGYGTVVVFFAALNAAAGRSVFLTPALLGESLLGRPVDGAVTAETVLLYNGVHLAIFLALGFIAAWLLLETERHPRLGYPSFLLALVLLLHAIGAVLWLAAPAAAAIPPWSVVVAGLAAGVVMTAVLVLSRPEAVAAFRAVDADA